MHRLDFGEIKNPQLPWEWRAEHRNGKDTGSRNFSVAKTSAVVAGAGGQLFITVIEEVMFFMVLPAEIITVKTAQLDWSHIKRRLVQGIELIEND